MAIDAVAVSVADSENVREATREAKGDEDVRHEAGSLAVGATSTWRAYRRRLSWFFRVDESEFLLIALFWCVMFSFFIFFLHSFLVGARRSKREMRRNPSITIGEEDAVGSVSFPKLVMCSEYWTDPGMQREWFTGTSATYYEGWSQAGARPEGEPVELIFLNAALYRDSSGVCLLLKPRVEPIASVHDWILLDLHFAPIYDEFCVSWVNGTNGTVGDCARYVEEPISEAFTSRLLVGEVNSLGGGMRVPYNKETVVYYEYMKEEDLDGGTHYGVRYYHQSSDIFFLNNPLGLPDNKDLMSPEFQRGAAYRARIWFNIPYPKVTVKSEVEGVDPLAPFAVFTTLFALLSTTRAIFDLFVHHAPPLKRRFLPRLHNTERELEKDLELSKRTRRVERDVADLLASFRSLRHRGEGLHDSDSDDDHKRAAR